MAEVGAVTQALLGIVRDGQEVAELAESICRACIAGLDIDGASISVLTDTDAREVLWASDETAWLMEELQISLNEGACIEAAHGGYPVLVADVHVGADAERWPFFAAALAERTGVAAVFALPLRWGTVDLGVLDLYRLTPGALTAAQRRDALAAADTAAVMLLTLRTEPATGGGTGGTVATGWHGWIDAATGHHAVVHQATGMVLDQLGVDAAEALARMRARAFVEHRLLIDIARDVVARRLRFDHNAP